MNEVREDIDRWLAVGETEIALATVLSTWGSAPRKAGAKLAFTAGGAAISGSVSGGCVEGAVIAAGDEVLASGRPQLLHFGVADETAWSVGLACGGTIEVFVERLNPAIYAVARDWLIREATGAVVTVVAGPEELLGCQLALGPDGVTGSLGKVWDELARASARAAKRPSRAWLAEGVEVFIDVLRPAPRLIIVGGAHIAVALVRLADVLGYRTAVIDPRRAFASAARFPTAGRLSAAWPDRALADDPPDADSAVITLSHDPKIDDPALRAALGSEAFYIGALGSRKTHAARRERLAAQGFSAEQLDRIHAPIGLDIGADNPEEIALAVMAEIVAAYRGKEAGEQGSRGAGEKG
ncbi:XdhC family protein [Promineifilum sp.]|uniref:XdhC family protein n=1 Tax=Promineifilum sp. TaxID=2664178 RepID=UPI0035B1A2F7